MSKHGQQKNKVLLNWKWILKLKLKREMKEPAHKFSRENFILSSRNGVAVLLSESGVTTGATASTKNRTKHNRQSTLNGLTLTHKYNARAHLIGQFKCHVTICRQLHRVTINFTQYTQCRYTLSLIKQCDGQGTSDFECES